MDIITSGITTTLIITAIALVFGIALGTLLAIVRSMQVLALNTLAKVYINVFRSLPLVMILLGFYLVAPGIVQSIFGINGDIRLACALVAFSLFEAAYFAEIIRTGFNAIPQTQMSACISNGFSQMQAYRHVLIPQAFKNSFPVLMTQAIVLFQDTALVYVIGLTDFFGGAVKLGEMKGNITTTILLASLAYLVICVSLQRVTNRLSSRAA